MVTVVRILGLWDVGVYLVALAFLFVADQGYAQGPPIFTETPIMLGLEGGGVRTFAKFISKQDEKVYVQPVVLPFNLSTKWQIGGVVPFIRVKQIFPKGQISRSGLSDV